MGAARQCDDCGTRHPVRNNEIWFETQSAGEAGSSFFCEGFGALVALKRRAGVQGLCTEACEKTRLCVVMAVKLVLPGGRRWALPFRTTAGFMRRTMHMYTCYKGVVYDMR
jgi:hypothetical protein